MPHLSRPHCLITGCAFVPDPVSGLYFWGDLHTIGEGVWCHNASTIRGPNQAMPVEHLASTVRIIMLNKGAVSFSRMGIFTFFRRDAKLNEAATEFLKGDSYAEL